MGKVLDYFGFDPNKGINKFVAFVETVHPQIENIIVSEIARLFPDELKDKQDKKKRDLLDEAVVSSLCFILSNYLSELATRPNFFNVNEENVGIFVNDIINQMLQTYKRKEN